MKGSRIWTAIVGILLVVAGAIGVLELSGLIPGFESALWRTLWPALFALGGLIFLAAFATRPHDRWPAAIPGCILLAIAVVAFFEDWLGDWGGTVFLGAIGLSFLLIFLARREFWWALIPAGALLTLGVVAGVDALSLPNGDLVGAVFFAGLALTFLVVYLVRDATGRRHTWALFPAVILALLAVLVALVVGGLVDENATWWLYVGPALLIVGGVVVLFKALTKKPRPEVTAPDEDVPLAKG